MRNAQPHVYPQVLDWAHQRWKIEQSYQQLTEELGLAQFEGRSWRGLHHHLLAISARHRYQPAEPFAMQQRVTSQQAWCLSVDSEPYLVCRSSAGPPTHVKLRAVLINPTCENA